MAIHPSVPSTFKLKPEIARDLDDAVRAGLVANKTAAANEALAEHLRRVRQAQPKR